MTSMTQLTQCNKLMSGCRFWLDTNPIYWNYNHERGGGAVKYFRHALKAIRINPVPPPPPLPRLPRKFLSGQLSYKFAPKVTRQQKKKVTVGLENVVRLKSPYSSKQVQENVVRLKILCTLQLFEVNKFTSSCTSSCTKLNILWKDEAVQ